MKKIQFFLLLTITAIFYSFNLKKYPSQPPTGYTGATGAYCISCHGGTPLNNSGGSVAVNGLPTNTYKADSVYNFSLTIQHTINNRQRWGFSIIAVNDSGNAVGSFNTTHAHAAVNGDELSHYYAITTNTSQTYTYNNLSWKAPQNNQNVKFYYVGMASNNSSGTDDDFVYSNSQIITLPLLVKSFTVENKLCNAFLTWSFDNAFDGNFIEIERSDDGQFYYMLNKINIANPIQQNKYTYTDNKTSNSGSSIFYRLKSTDKQGRIVYSKQIPFKQINNSSLVVQPPYPSLTKPGEIIRMGVFVHYSTNVDLSLITQNGTIIATQKNQKISTGNNTLPFQLPNHLSKGIYFIKCSNSKFIKTFAIIIQ